MSTSAWTRARELIASIEEPAPTLGDARLRERASRLAMPIAPADRSAPEHALEVTCGGRTAWIGIGHVQRVHELRRITRVPVDAPLLLGVARFARQLLPVFDLGPLIGERPSRLSPLESRLVAIGSGTAELAIAVESTSGTVELSRGPTAIHGAHASFVGALGPGGQVVIDCERLLADPRLSVGPREGT